MSMDGFDYSAALDRVSGGGNVAVYVSQEHAHACVGKFDAARVRSLLESAICALDNLDGTTATREAAEAFARLAMFHR